MEIFDITNRKEFMAKLLKSDLFESFEVREVISHTAFKLIIDGKRNKEYFNDIQNDSDIVYSEYLSWSEIRKHVYELMQGHTLPTYFKIVLSTKAEKTAQLSPDAATFYLNITFKDNQITCSTGTAYKSFTLDKSADQIWDERIKQFLFKYQFI
ncbi:MAG: hypothetical protein J6F30_00595 [Cellulosilyticum sp.]|nr:hypothetical protein [Cellulosilyticum sp.]